jgi:diphosphomevalonate decarboxylase
MNKKLIVEKILGNIIKKPIYEKVDIFAPSNVALCKYWGKRNEELNLPITSSLSISLGHLGTETIIEIIDGAYNEIFLNREKISNNSAFTIKLLDFLSIFPIKNSFKININSNIPISAGLASSACGFASMIMALNKLYGWHLSSSHLSILARLGSGSAARSVFNGFVEWDAGIRDDGMDSFGVLLPSIWKNLRVGILLINSQPKLISSREAMKQTLLSSPFYSLWPNKQLTDLNNIKYAIETESFYNLGQIAESNSLAMHALMQTAIPSIIYSQGTTIEIIHKIWNHRKQGVELFFTQDAGPNLKLLFQEKDTHIVKNIFPTIEIANPFKIL